MLTAISSYAKAKNSTQHRIETTAHFDQMYNKYTPCSKKLVHQAHIDNLVNSQRIFKMLSLTHSAENLL